MPDTIAERVKAAFYADVVQAAATSAGATSFRARTEPMGALPAIGVSWGACPKVATRSGEDVFSLFANIEIYVTGDDDEAADVGLDALYGPISAQIASVSNSSNLLGGLAEDIRETGTESPDEADSDANLVVTVQIDFVTKWNDPYNLPTA